MLAGLPSLSWLVNVTIAGPVGTSVDASDGRFVTSPQAETTTSSISTHRMPRLFHVLAAATPRSAICGRTGCVAGHAGAAARATRSRRQVDAEHRARGPRVLDVDPAVVLLH